jgi:hypothetical protein
MRAATITTRATETTPRRRPSWGKSMAFLRVKLIRAPKPTKTPAISAIAINNSISWVKFNPTLIRIICLCVDL